MVTTVVGAIYQDGVFKPTEDVALRDGSHVELAVTASGDVCQPDGAGELARIAALPLEGPDDGFSGADHDRALYGGAADR